MANFKKLGKHAQGFSQMKRSINLKKISCSVVITGICSQLHTQAFMPHPLTNGNSNCLRHLNFNKLWFRNGDDLDSEEFRNKHEEAASLVCRGPIARNAKKPVSTCLAHINSVIAGQRDIPKEQRNIDDYLEFLDRRYNRLHSDETPAEMKVENKKAMSLAWNRLFDESQPNTRSLNQSVHEDALYVLGVAELASKRLLQKHHPIQNKKNFNLSLSPTTMEKTKTSNVIEFQHFDSFTLTQSLNKHLIQGVLSLRNFQTRKSAFLMSKTKLSIRLFMISSRKMLQNIIVLSKNRALLLGTCLQKISSVALSTILSLFILCRGIIHQRIRGA